jgi:hypothetical protein
VLGWGDWEGSISGGAMDRGFCFLMKGVRDEILWRNETMKWDLNLVI